VAVTFVDAGEEVGLQTITSSGNGCKAALATLKNLLGEEFQAVESERVLQRVLAAAARTLRESAEPEGPRLAEIVTRVLEAQLQPRCVGTRGVWCEGLGLELSRGSFLETAIGDAVLGPAAAAVDVPRPMPHLPPTRLDLMRAVEAEAKIVFANWLSALPRQGDVDLGPTTQAAQRFREAIIRLWHAPVTFEKEMDVNGRDLVSSATLASRVLSKSRRNLSEAGGPSSLRTRDGWRQVHPAYGAYWRPFDTPDSESILYLAMKFTLDRNKQLQGVTDQRSLCRLGESYGVFEKQPPVKRRLGGGSTLAVLTVDLCREILEEPERELADEAEPVKE
jgi:hypothetical protein